IGLASIATGFAETPLQIGIGLFVIGMFAAIYHPVGLAIVTMKWKNTGMRIAVNGVWGNLGVAAAALVTGYLIDFSGWRAAFILPGAFSIVVGFAYMALRREGIRADQEAKKDAGAAPGPVSESYRSAIIRVAAIVFVTAAVGSIIFSRRLSRCRKSLTSGCRGWRFSCPAFWTALRKAMRTVSRRSSAPWPSLSSP
ncbi:MAG: MFS transporter, partial [Rhodospirillaceae bacterium]|nr:MFS transporter [Rhodospirillaceae bacterium]